MNSIKKFVHHLYLLLVTITLFCPSYLFAGEKGNENAITNKVDTSNLSGISLWLVNLYNEERVVFALVVTLSMAVIGILIAKIADLVLKLVGFETTKIEHHE